MKNHILPKLLIISLLLTCGLMVSASAHASNYRKTITDYAMFYYPENWDIIITTYSLPSHLSETIPSPLLVVNSPEFTTPVGKDGEAQVLLSAYNAGGKSLKSWFRDYKKRTTVWKSVHRKKYTTQPLYNYNKYIIKVKNGMVKYYFIKKGNVIYSIIIASSSIDKGNSWDKGKDIIDNILFY